MQAARAGDTEAVAKELKFVANTAVEDAATVRNQALTAARARLMARR